MFFLGNSHLEDLKRVATHIRRDIHTLISGTGTAWPVPPQWEKQSSSHLRHAFLVGIQQPHWTTLKTIMYENLLFVYGCYKSPKVVLVSFLRALKIVDHYSKKNIHSQHRYLPHADAGITEKWRNICNICHLWVLKFGMTFLSHFVIHLLFLVININWEIIFNHYKFKLSWTQIFFYLQTLFFITFCTLSLIVMFILLYMQ